MSKTVRVSQLVPAEHLIAELGHQNGKRRIVLIAGPKNQSELRRFLRSIEIPATALPDMAGSMFGYTNYELHTPEKAAYFAIEALGAAEVGWQVIADAARGQGYRVADLQENILIPSDSESPPVPLEACVALLHNVST